MRLPSKNVVSRRRGGGEDYADSKEQVIARVRRHGGNDENRMNAIQMKCQSVVETANVREPTKDIPFDRVGIYGSYSFLPHRYVYRIAAGTIVSYLPISSSSPTSLLSDSPLLSSLDLFPNDVSFVEVEVKIVM